MGADAGRRSTVLPGSDPAPTGAFGEGAEKHSHLPGFPLFKWRLFQQQQLARGRERTICHERPGSSDGSPVSPGVPCTCRAYFVSTSFLVSESPAARKRQR
jgi:hypothetical protein